MILNIDEMISMEGDSKEQSMMGSLSSHRNTVNTPFEEFTHKKVNKSVGKQKVEMHVNVFVPFFMQLH